MATSTRSGAPRAGFTLIELVVTVTLVSIVALVAVPLYEVTVARAHESELRSALRQIRSALDAYKAAADTGAIARGAADSGYPPDLKTLVDGVDVIAGPIGAAAAPANGAPGMVGTLGGPSSMADASPGRMVFLRQVPRDPFFEDQSVAPELQWNLRAYGALRGDFGSGSDVYDVSSRSIATGLNGIPLKDW